MKPQQKIIGALLSFSLVVLPALASQFPDLNRPADIQTLKLSKSGSDIRLNCTDGVGPEFGMARNNLVTFSDPASLVLNTGSLCAFTDVGELSQINTRFYILADSQAPPRVMDTSPATLKPGDTTTVRGLGLKGAVLHTPRGAAISPSVDTSISVSYNMPITGECSGWGLLLTPWGADHTSFFNIPNWIPPANNTLYDVAFYQDATDTTRRLIVTDREGANNRVYVINPFDLTNSVITLSSGVPNPMGLSLGVLSDSKNYAFYGPGNVVFGTLAATPILKLDFLAVPPVQSLFRNISLSNGNDNANVRATAFIPSGAGVTENEVFAFNPNPSSGNQFDIRLGKETTTGFTTWANLGTAVNGTTIDRNYPAGLGLRDQFVTVGSHFSFYVTNGKAVGTTPIKSQVLYYNSDTAVPPNHALLWTSPFDTTDMVQAKPYITNAAQIAKEGWGEEFAFVADRGNANPPAGYSVVPSRVFKMNANNCLVAGDCPSTGTSKAFLSAFEYGRSLTDIKGVAIQRGTDVSGGTYSKFLWLINKLPAGFPVTGNGISQVRALREIPIKLFIGRHAGNDLVNYYTSGGANYLNSGTKITTAFIRDYIVNIVIPRANHILYNIGYQIKFDPATDLVMDFDDSNLNFSDYSYRITGGAVNGECPTEISNASGLAGHITADAKRVNIVIVHAMRLANTDLPVPPIDPNTLAYDTSNGIYKRYTALCGGFSNLVMINYAGSSGTALNKNFPISPNIFAHELFHKLTAVYLQGVGGANGFDATGHRPLTSGACDETVVSQNRCPGNHLMCPCDALPFENLQVSGANANDRDDDLANIFNGLGLEFVLPDNGAP